MNMAMERTTIQRRAASGLPECRYERDDCHACRDGRCVALSDTDFGSRDCPFYRNKRENVQEVSLCLNILIRKGRSDLIDKYRPVYLALNLLGGEDDFIHDAKARLEAKKTEMRAEIERRRDYVNRIGGEWYE